LLILNISISVSYQHIKQFLFGHHNCTFYIDLRISRGKNIGRVRVDNRHGPKGLGDGSEISHKNNTEGVGFLQLKRR